MRSLARLRRSAQLAGGFDPLSLSPSAWYFAESLFTTSGGSTAPTALNDPVGQATDLSGNARHCVQGTAGSRPQYDPTGVNGLPAIYYEGTATRFLSTGNFAAALSQPNTVYCVFRNVDSNTQRNVYDGTAAGGRNLLWFNGSGLQVGMWAGGAQYDYARVEPGVYLYTCQYNGASSIMRRNGAVIRSAVNPGAQAMGGVTLGADNAGTGSKFKGYIREFIAFNAAHTTSQMEQVEAFLAGRSGITLYTQATSGTIAGNAWQTLVANVPSNKWVFFYHGRSQAPAPTAFLADSQLVALYQLILARGWHIGYTNNTTAFGWGNLAGQNEHVAFEQMIAARETVSRAVNLGQSMGGCAGQALIADNRVPTKQGFFGIYPVCDQKAVHDSPGTFAAEIESAFSTNAAGLEAASAAYNPLRLAASLWSGKRWVVTHSASDTVVEKAANSTAMKTYITGQATSPTIIDTSGEHGDNSNFDATVQSALGTFLDDCAA